MSSIIDKDNLKQFLKNEIFYCQKVMPLNLNLCGSDCGLNCDCFISDLKNRQSSQNKFLLNDISANRIPSKIKKIHDEILNKLNQQADQSDSYVYVYVNSKKVLYVGKGVGIRCYDHLFEALICIINKVSQTDEHTKRFIDLILSKENFKILKIFKGNDISVKTIETILIRYHKKKFEYDVNINSVNKIKSF